MKQLLNLTLAIAISLMGLNQSQAQWGGKKVVGNGNSTSKTVNTGSYDAIHGVGSMDIHLERGAEGNITVTADDNLHKYIIIEVKDNALVLKMEKNINIRTKNGIHIRVPFQDISEVYMVGSGDMDSKDTVKSDDLKLKVTGSGNITLDVATNTLDTKITGSGDIELKGSTTNLEVSVTGSGDFDGFDLDAQNTTATVSGSGDIKVVAKSSLKARVSGSGDIYYKGNPEKSDTKTSGSGDITSH
jgi:hypothetical protein